MPARSIVTESNDAAHRRAARVVERRDSWDVSCFCCGMAATGSAPGCPSDASSQAVKPISHWSLSCLVSPKLAEHEDIRSDEGI